MQVYGVVHLKSLPGSPSNRLSIDEIIDSAQEDVNSLVYGGCLLYTSPSPRDRG